MENIEARLALFRELLESVNPSLILAELDDGFDLLHTNARDHILWTALFRYAMAEPITDADLPRNWVHEQGPMPGPYVFTNNLGMTWMSESEVQAGRVIRVVILGPVFLDEYAPKQIENKLLARGLSFSLIRPFMDLVQTMPVMSLNRLYMYGIMLHRCITGENCRIQDFIYPEMPKLAAPEDEVSTWDLKGHYRVESEILQIVETGNVDYDENVLNTLKLSGNTNRKIGGDTEFLRRAKNTLNVFITLSSRAAIRGGVSPENALYLADQYISQAERTANVAQLNELSRNMFTRFVQLVHRARLSQSTMSAMVADACSYIQLHIQEKLDIHQLAQRANYADYYFSRRFRQEAGMSVRDYIMAEKVRKAKEMLRDPFLEISEIAFRLGFESQSHLTEIFRKDTGLSPGKWRANSQGE